MKPKRPWTFSIVSAISSNGCIVFANVRSPAATATTSDANLSAIVIASAWAALMSAGVGTGKSIILTPGWLTTGAPRLVPVRVLPGEAERTEDLILALLHPLAFTVFLVIVTED